MFARYTSYIIEWFLDKSKTKITIIYYTCCGAATNIRSIKLTPPPPKKKKKKKQKSEHQNQDLKGLYLSSRRIDKTIKKHLRKKSYICFVNSARYLILSPIPITDRIRPWTINTIQIMSLAKYISGFVLNGILLGWIHGKQVTKIRK